jgi:hypothetical protein
MPQLYVILPVGGGDGGQIDNTLPGGPPGHVSNRPPGSWGGEHPGNRPPGSWGGEHPGNWVPGQGGGPVDPGWGGGAGSGNYPTGGPIIPPQGGTPVEDYQPLPPPEDIYSQYVVSVWNPKTASWTTKSYPPR